MPNIQVKLRRGTTAQHAGFTGAEGEVTVDTDKETLVVHDNATAGGHELRKKSDSNFTTLEVGHPTAALIDLKTPDTDDYDARVISQADTATLESVHESRVRVESSSQLGLVAGADPSTATPGPEVVTIKQSEVVVNEQGDDVDFRVEGLGGGDLINTNAQTNTVGIGMAAGAHRLSVDGDLLVQDTGDNFPAAIFAGSLGSAIQLNDQSTGGQTYNISSNPDSAGRGGFGIGHIAQAGTPLTITHVSSTATLATFSTSSAHGLTEGQYGALSGGDASWAGFVEIVDVPSTTTFVVPKISVSTNYPTTLTPNDTVSTLIIRRHEESSVLYNMIKILGLPKDIDDGGAAGTQPSWLEPGQLWIDTTDNSIKINPEVTT